jgi:tRNA(Ile)-lysidine synthase
MTSLSQQVESTLQTRDLLRRGGKLLVAVSGGVDSMVLLHLLNSLAAPWGWELSVAHFNHQLRGRSSDLDEKLVRQTADILKLPVTVGRADVKAFAKTSGLSLEMAARKLRHEFLAATARAGKIPAIALAHHADDQVELFFLRLLRGAGGEGLAGMKWRSPSPMDPRLTLIRPLLDVPKAGLEAFAREAGIAFRTDATNVLTALPRNRVRNELLPLLRAQYQPGLARTVLRVMEIVGAESDLAGELASGWLAGPALPPFAGLPVAVQRRVVQSQLTKLGLAVDFELVEQLRLSPNHPVSAGLKLLVVRDSEGGVRLQENRVPTRFNLEEREIELSGRAGEVSFSGATIEWELTKAGNRTWPVIPQPGREIFDADQVGKTVGLRHWRPGDRFQPLGMKSAVKLQDLFTNARIARERRRELLVAEAGGEIFWVEGLRMAERFKLSKTTKRGLVWRWSRRTLDAKKAGTV